MGNLKSLNTFFNKFNTTLDTLIATLLGGIMLLTIFQVLCRFVFFFPAPWVEELISFLFVWMIFIGTAVAQITQENTRIELIPLQSDRFFDKSVLTLSDLLVLLFALIVCFYGFELVKMTASMPSLILKISMGFFYLSAPVGALVIIGVIISTIWRRFLPRR